MHHIKHDLALLKARDTGYRIFGATTHQYHLIPVSPPALQQLEATLGVTLPPAYRDFLLTIGAGSGPYYGLWDGVEVLAEWRDWRNDYQQAAGVIVDPARPFPFTNADAQAVVKEWHAHRKPAVLTTTWPCDGCIPIAHHGCTYWSVLVTSGTVAGTVWDLSVFQGFDGELSPAFRPPGVVAANYRPKELPPLAVPPSFEDWYHGWVVQSLTDLGAW